jgi:hypothetical protein
MMKVRAFISYVVFVALVPLGQQASVASYIKLVLQIAALP